MFMWNDIMCFRWEVTCMSEVVGQWVRLLLSTSHICCTSQNCNHSPNSISHCGVENILMYSEKYLPNTEKFKFTHTNAGIYWTAAAANSISYPNQASFSVLVLLWYWFAVLQPCHVTLFFPYVCVVWFCPSCCDHIRTNRQKVQLKSQCLPISMRHYNGVCVCYLILSEEWSLQG